MLRFISWLLIALFVAIILGFSWIVTCGIIYLITLCFGWSFSWGIATGIWLIFLFVVPLLKPRITVKK